MYTSLVAAWEFALSFFTSPDDVLVTLKSVQRRFSFVFWVFYKCKDREDREEYFIRVFNVDYAFWNINLVKSNSDFVEPCW